MNAGRIASALLFNVICAFNAHAGTDLLVVCAPGYPGNTTQAQPAMDALAAGVVKQLGWSEGALSAVYHEKESAGLEALSTGSATLAIVPLPFYLKHRTHLALSPLLEVEQISADSESWALVAKRGAVKEPSDLAGWEVDSLAGYSPLFVRGVALSSWGELSRDTRIEFTPRVLSALRKSAGGESVAVLLDRGQTDALSSLPFSNELEVIARSPDLPGQLLCAVGDRLSTEASASLTRKLPTMSETADGSEMLESIRISRFAPLDAKALARIESEFDGARDDQE
jgi:hypothetical protein